MSDMENRTQNYGPKEDLTTKWNTLKVKLLFWVCVVLCTVLAGIYYSGNVQNTMVHYGNPYYADNIHDQSHTRNQNPIHKSRNIGNTVNSTADIGNWKTGVFELKPPSLTCKVAQFIETYKSENSSLSASGLSLVEACNLVFYARTPKCGSRTVRDIFKKLANIHHFRAKMLGFKSSLSQMNMAKNFQPTIVTAHTPFKNYSSIREGKEVVFVNIIRDPIEHLKSVYSFAKYGSVKRDNGRPGHPNYKLAHLFKQSLETCLSDRGLKPPCVRESFMGLRYLCGMQRVCRSRRNNKARLQIAKKNVARYFLIGLTEDLAAFFEILDIFLPRMFQGATEVYHQMRDATYGKWKTRHKETISNNTRQFLQTELGPDIELYNFVKSQFYRTLQKVRDYKSIQIDNNLR